GRPAGAIAWADRSTVYRLHISFGQMRRGTVTHMFPVAVQKKNRTTQSLSLTFHQKDKAGQNIRQRRIGSDHLKHAALTGAKKFFLLDLGDITANNHAA